MADKLNHDALRALRVKDGYSGADFAKVIGITPGHLFNIEAGRRGCSSAIARLMAETLGVPISALMWRQDAA